LSEGDTGPDCPLTLALSREGRGDLGVLPARFTGADSWRVRAMGSLPRGERGFPFAVVEGPGASSVASPRSVPPLRACALHKSLRP